MEFSLLETDKKSNARLGKVSTGHGAIDTLFYVIGIRKCKRISFS